MSKISVALLPIKRKLLKLIAMKKLILVLMLLIGMRGNAQIWQLSENIYFETTDSLLKIDTNLIGNIWQIGTPSKTFFDSAYSVPNAIVTDTTKLLST